jgi:hypothetical protein
VDIMSKEKKETTSLADKIAAAQAVFDELASSLIKIAIDLPVKIFCKLAAIPMSIVSAIFLPDITGKLEKALSSVEKIAKNLPIQDITGALSSVEQIAKTLPTQGITGAMTSVSKSAVTGDMSTVLETRKNDLMESIKQTTFPGDDENLDDGTTDSKGEEPPKQTPGT